MFEKQDKLTLLSLSKSLSNRKDAGLLRSKKTFQAPCSTQIKFSEKQWLNFASNDYLGLANNHSAITAIQEGVLDNGFGSGASHLICGHQQAHEDFDQAIAQFLQRDAAITFSTGYMANLAILQSLAKKGDLIIADKLNHASLIDGVRLSDAESTRYPHCDLKQLEKRLQKEAKNKFVVTDSVFSMDGDVAPLREIAEICQRYDAVLIVDDAHGFGVLGENGRGVCEAFGLDQNLVPVLMTTLGKALGGFGASVSGKKELTDYLTQFARPYVYTTAMPAINALGNLANLQRLKTESQLVRMLQKNIQYFRQKAAESGVELMSSTTAIQPVLIGDNDKLQSVNQYLSENNILVGAIRPPTVPVNSARLRITLSAQHTAEQIDYLVSMLALSLHKAV